ncbi:hypothetical protein UPYG_G00227680 [Umbra pygmaea]|uniref:Ig-like domain-containing protein n=1 Tax=Umbra pygmaea TaxID=75934 RepID=A0ABD0X3A9_UMBPY
MISAVIIITVPLFWITGVSFSKEVYQSPSMMLINPEDSTTFNCSHKIKNYDTVLWYHRPVGDTALNLIGCMYYKSPNLESSYTSNFNVTGDGEKEAQLHLLKLRQSTDSGEYFCAASRHSGAESQSSVQKPHHIPLALYQNTCMKPPELTDLFSERERAK